MSSSNTSYVDTARERNALRSILRLFLDGSIERHIDQIEQKTTYRVFGPVGWTDPFKHLSDALRAGGFIREADAEFTARTTCDPILSGDL